MRAVAAAVLVALLLAGCGGADPARVDSRGGIAAADAAPAASVAATTTTTTVGADPAAAPSITPPAIAPAATASTRPVPRPRPAAASVPVVKQPPPRPNRSTGATPVQSPPPTSRAVFDGDFPDPYILRAGAHWYAFSTQSGATQVPVLRSVDLRTWERVGDALAALPSWSTFGYVWAPAVAAPPLGGFVLYYATRDARTGLQCLSRAVSPRPEGPYVDASTTPFVCQTDRGGSIDPSPFTAADGSLWLTWKSEGTLEGEPTRIWTAPMTPDGMALAADAREVLSTSEVWEGPIVEAPTMVFEGHAYHLFFSGNRWETADYAIGHAVCDGPAGPCRRVPAEPVVRTDAVRAGPGGGEVVRDVDGSLLLAHHAWSPDAVGYPAGARRLHIDRITIDGADAAISPRQDTSMI